MTQCSILFVDAQPWEQGFIEKANRNYKFKIDFHPFRLSLESANLIKGHEVVCAFVNDDLSAPVIEKLHANKVKLIAMRCTGHNNVDLGAAEGKVRIVNVPNYSPQAVAEHAVGLILSLSRKYPLCSRRMSEHNFTLDGLMGFNIHGKTVGIIGAGSIGKATAQILKGFGANVLLYDIAPDFNFAKQIGATFCPLESLLAQSDIVSLHCPLTPKTKHIVHATTLTQMKEGVVLINTGRGALVHTQDLIEALKSGKVAFAGLDVYENETPYFFENWSDKKVQDEQLLTLLSMPNVIVTPHQGFFTKEALEQIAQTTLENIAAFSEGRALINEVKA
ncbi:MAG: 2-hydroxyacid dehydrogenase [Verrucomicrobia bacterium]|nr:2-hydroxyacid dehydrogenase [Verrucomicrobiota bacterium]